MWQRIKEAWRQAQERAQEQTMAKYATPAGGLSGAISGDAREYLEEVFAAFPYTEEAKQWLRERINFDVQDLRSVRGGGYWDPGRNLVFLYTAQYEAAIHELSHAWWHTRRLGQEEAMMQATIALSEERDPRYARTQGLAYGYIHGIPAQGWAGMLVERNDWEMYAGLASGMMADLRLVPPYVRRFYEGMYQLLPDDAPSPAARARHG
jgi:hypothetical protein